MMKKKDISIISPDVVERKIYLIRGYKVLLDSDLAMLYAVPTKRLNEQVKRNRKRFPPDFMFQLTINEAESLRSQIATSKDRRGGRRTRPYVFTEQGVAMLSSVLNSERAVQVNIAIVRAFVRFREILASNKILARRLELLEKKYDKQFRVIFTAIQELMSPKKPPENRRFGFRAELQ